LKIIKYNPPTAYLRVIIFLFFPFLNGCAGMDQLEKEAHPEPLIINNALPFTDVPVPSGFSRDLTKSFVYDTGNDHMKVGHLFFHGNTGLKATVEFYRNEMTNKGWTLVNSMASVDTFLNYRKEGWVCTIIIRPRSFNRSVIEVQIGPVQIKSQ
jgi:hypothetical protein